MTPEDAALISEAAQVYADQLGFGRSATSGDFPVASAVCRYCGEQIRQMRYMAVGRALIWHHASDDAVCCVDEDGYHAARPLEEGEDD